MVPTASDTILVVEDDIGVAELERRHLQRAGYRVEIVGTSDAALERIARGGIDLIVLDYRLPGNATGLDVYAVLKASGREVPVILVTGFSDELIAIKALRAGVSDFVSKSAEYLEYLPESVGRVLKQARMHESLHRTEEQLRYAQKMEAIGRLAGGVAHDFNNLLTVIIGYGELAAERLEGDHPARADLEEIRQAAERSAALTHQLLAFSRQQTVNPQIIDLNVVVPNIQKMLSRLIGEDVELSTVLASDLSRVWVDGGQIEQVIMNLAINARDAMPDGGRLIIETADVELDETFSTAHLNVMPGRYVLLAVSDTGCGMDAVTQAHIFEPFFTTKEPGKGTGLGLATVYGIVTQSGGHVFVDSEPQHGTTFKIYFPAVKDPAEQQLIPEDSDIDFARSGSEVILLVEDQNNVRTLARKILAGEGYRLLEAQTAEEAIHLCECEGVQIDLLLTDVIMPGQSGRQLAARFRELHPGARVLFMSGYTGELVLNSQFNSSEVPFLQKPFSAQALVQGVRSVLDGTRPNHR